MQAGADQADCSLADYIRFRVLAADDDSELDARLPGLEDRLSQLYADLFGLKALIEQGLAVDISRASQELEPASEPVAFYFARHVENFQDLYLEVKAINAER